MWEQLLTIGRRECIFECVCGFLGERHGQRAKRLIQLDPHHFHNDLRRPARVVEGLKSRDTIIEEVLFNVSFLQLSIFFHSTGDNLSHGALEIQVWVALDFIHILGVQDDQRSWCSYELKDIQALLDISTGSFAGH